VAKAVQVSGKDGWKGIVHSWFGGSPGAQDAHEITIRLDSGETVVVPDSVLTGKPDGSYYVPLSLAELGGEGGEPAAEPVAAAPESIGDTNEPVVIPVIEEELEVGKRTVQTGAGVRIRKSAREEKETVDLPLILERVDVERVPVGRMVDAPVPVRHVGDTIIVPVVEEVIVVQKQYRLVEELHIRKTRTETRDPQTFVLRKEEAVVERMEGPRQNPGENQSGTDDLRAV
jgi:uncharacterized protein (TIGR02271 family)